MPCQTRRRWQWDSNKTLWAPHVPLTLTLLTQGQGLSYGALGWLGSQRQGRGLWSILT